MKTLIAALLVAFTLPAFAGHNVAHDRNEAKRAENVAHQRDFSKAERAEARRDARAGRQSDRHGHAH